MEKLILDGVPYGKMLEDVRQMAMQGMIQNKVLLREMRAMIQEELKGALKGISCLNDKQFSRREAAKLLGVSYRRVRTLLHKGVIIEDVATGKIPGRCLDELLTKHPDE